MHDRLLGREEIEKLREIDRSEIVEKLYHINGGMLDLCDEFYDVTNEWWIKEEVEKILLPRLKDLFTRGGTIIGAFDRANIGGMIALESKFIGKERDQLKLDILFVSKKYRRTGVGKHLMWLAIEKAREMGASRLYISATPSQNTIDFDMSLGCRLATEIDKELFELEPEDIHLELEI